MKQIVMEITFIFKVKIEKILNTAKNSLMENNVYWEVTGNAKRNTNVYYMLTITA